MLIVASFSFYSYFVILWVICIDLPILVSNTILIADDVRNKTAGVIGGEGTAKLSEAHELTPGFSGACVCQSLVFVCRFVLFMLDIVFSVLRFTGPS